MAGRTHESPMDFEYQNGTGPMDARSPFAQVGMNSQRNSGNDKKRSFAMFGSPNKPSFPSLREPQSQPHFFASPKPLPALPPQIRNNPLFSTPRKLDADDFASSGGETPKSPERGDVDSDATPDMNFRSKFANLDTMTKPVFTAGGKKEKEKEKEREQPSRRQSWWRGLSNLGSSPRSSKDDYAHGAERKIIKRRSKQTQALARGGSISESEQDSPARHIFRSRKVGSRHNKGDQHQQPPQDDKPHWGYTLFEFITQHPTLPHILSFYAQLMLNLFLISGIMYVVYSFWATIRSDVDKKSNEAVVELLAEMATCAKQYTVNRCDPETRVPALQTVCDNLAKCMNQNPKNVGRARVSAHTFAEIFNGFIEPISYKAMIFSVVLIFGSIAISNFAFSIFRDKAAAHANAQHHHYYSNNMPPPPTPQRQFSGGHDGYWTPYHQGQQLGLEPAPSQSRQESPVRRLQFH